MGIGGMVAVLAILGWSAAGSFASLLALHVIACGLLLLAASDAAAFGFAMVYGAANGLVTIVRPLVVADWMGISSFGAASGRMAAWTLPFRALAPFLLGVVHDLGGDGPVIGVLIACAPVGLVAALRAEARRRPAEPLGAS